MLATRFGWRTASRVLNRCNTQKPKPGLLSVFPGSSAASFPRSLAPCSEQLGLHAYQPCRSFGRESKQRKEPKEIGGIIVARNKGKDSGYCYGCGADLVLAKSPPTGGNIQMETVRKKKNYWNAKKEEIKKSKISNWALCPRCKRLQKMAKRSNQLAATELADLSPNHEMTEVFRTEVAKIRAKEKAVVVLCVDAINISGSLIKTIRNYVGGNPILLAVTRCDLLPAYVWERYGDDLQALKKVFRQRARDIIPADVYLCSEDSEYRKKTGGLQELTQDLWDNLNGRDPYVVGAANIGKSTLTDILIAKLAGKGEKALHFGDKMSQKRLDKLRTARITKSSLPGTTLQNVRVPCFEDHTQALWDTPGLLLDESFKHFPIRNLRAIRAQRPSQIEPHIIETDKKAFCLLICEKGDDLPLMRIEVRLKKSAEGEGPVRLVWNSTLNLDTKIVDIATAMDDERKRAEKVAAEKEHRKYEEEKRLQEIQKELVGLTPEEKEERRLQKKLEYERQVEEEKARLGIAEWKRLQAERRAEFEETKRIRALAQLIEVHQVVLERGIGIDLATANFGWLGVLVPRTALIKSYAPNTGVRVSRHPTIGLPLQFGEYAKDEPKAETKDTEASQAGSDSGLDEDDLDYDDDMFDDWNHGDLDDFDDVWAFDENDPYGMNSREDRFGFNQSDEEKQDKWAKFSGENVGWQFNADTRFMKADLEEGWNPIRQKTSDLLD